MIIMQNIRSKKYILKELPSHKLIWKHFKQTPSTQTMAIETVSNEVLKKPLLITADVQTQGYGTNQREWKSPSGNLFATFCILEADFNSLLYKHESIQQKHNRSNEAILCAQIMQNAIMKLTGKTTTLKEPNDILYMYKKCAGILVSKIEDKQRNTVLCIGIGFNCAVAPKTTQPTIAIKCNKYELIFSWITLLSQGI